MKTQIFVTLLLTVFTLPILLSLPSQAQQYHELYSEWYVGDWVAKSEEFDGRKVWYAMRIKKHRDVEGCVIYPNKDGVDRKLFGQLSDTDLNKIEIRLSNAREINFYKRGKSPRNLLVAKIVQKKKSNSYEIEFEREFIPATCIE